MSHQNLIESKNFSIHSALKQRKKLGHEDDWNNDEKRDNQKEIPFIFFWGSKPVQAFNIFRKKINFKLFEINF